VLAAACVIAALVGLNLHWAQLAREKDVLRKSLEASFRAALKVSAAVTSAPMRSRVDTI
jgi:hypothetical protein